MLVGLWLDSPAWAQRPVIHRIHATSDARQDSVFQLGSTITLEVSGLGNWIRQREKQLQGRVDAPHARLLARDLVLYIDDAPLLNMPPLAVYTDETKAPTLASNPTRLAPPTASTAGATPPSPGDPTAKLMEAIDSTAQAASQNSQPDSTLGFALDALPAGGRDKVVFQLRRDPSNARYWNVLYNSPWEFTHPSKIGLGYADQVFTDLYPGPTRTVSLQLIEPGSLWVAGLVILVLGGGLLALGVRSWLLRDTASDGNDDDPDSPTPTIDATDPPYSLSRVQLAWWIFIIIGGHVVVYCVTGVMPDISTTSLALLGISAGTTVLSSLTTSGQGASAAATPATGPPERSRGFLTDLLSDEHGVCIHRLQKMIISLVMGGFYIRTVYDTVATPVWTANQTLLMAISSATYLGLKWQENSINSAAASSVAGAAGAADTAPSPGSTFGTTSSAATWATPAAMPTLPLANGSTATTDPLAAAAPPTPASPLPMASVGSVADPVTGAVIQRDEDDMGPPDPSTGYVPSEQDTEQVPG